MTLSKQTECCENLPQINKCLYHYDEYQKQEYINEFLDYLNHDERCAFEQELQKAIESMDLIYTKYNFIASNRISSATIKKDIEKLIVKLLDSQENIRPCIPDLFFL